MAPSNTLLWLTIVTALSVAQPSSIFRLPATILPTHYDLLLHPNIDEGTSRGEATIDLNITTAYFDSVSLSDNFTVSFNFKPDTSTYSMSIDENFPVLFRDDGAADPILIALSTLSLNGTTQIAVASFDVTNSEVQSLLSANVWSLSFAYSASIRGGADLAGWYKSTYSVDGVLIENVVTQFQATDARSVFPSFDEPAFKATFNVTFIAPAEAVKLSNMPIDGYVEPFFVYRKMCAVPRCLWMRVFYVRGRLRRAQCLRCAIA